MRSVSQGSSDQSPFHLRWQQATKPAQSSSPIHASRPPPPPPRCRSAWLPACLAPPLTAAGLSAGAVASPRSWTTAAPDTMRGTRHASAGTVPWCSLRLVAGNQGAGVLLDLCCCRPPLASSSTAPPAAAAPWLEKHLGLDGPGPLKQPTAPEKHAKQAERSSLLWCSAAARQAGSGDLA